jgi:hypothetical protein
MREGTMCTLNHAPRSFLRRSCFLSFCNFTNRPTSTLNGALPMFCGGIGYDCSLLSSTSAGGGDLGGEEGAGVGCIIAPTSWLRERLRYRKSSPVTVTCALLLCVWLESANRTNFGRRAVSATCSVLTICHCILILLRSSLTRYSTF